MNEEIPEGEQAHWCAVAVLFHHCANCLTGSLLSWAYCSWAATDQRPARKRQTSSMHMKDQPT